MNKHFYYGYSKADIKELVKLGLLIRKQRLNLKMSQAQLAFELGTDGRHIRRIENGEVNISFLTFIKLCNALSLNTQELLPK